MVVLLVVATGVLCSVWIPPIIAAGWTFGVLTLHAIIIRYCRKFLAKASSAPATTRKWRLRFVALDLLYGLAWSFILIHPSGIDVVSNTLMLFLMLLVGSGFQHAGREPADRCLRGNSPGCDSYCRKLRLCAELSTITCSQRLL